MAQEPSSKENASETSASSQPTVEQYNRLKEERDRLREVLNLTPMGLYVYDEELRIRMCNRTVTQFLGVSMEECLGKRLDELLDPDTHEVNIASARAAISSREPVFLPEEVLVNADGVTRIFDFYEIPFRDPETGRRSALGLAHDITERKQRERMARDLHIAREIQRGLLPPELPHLKEFEIAGWNQAADETGGDYFDWLSLPDGRTVVCIADATGHGIGPALITAVCRAYFRATCSFETRLEQTFVRVNQLLSGDLPPGRFVTAAAAILDPAQRQIQLFSCGHGPILFYEAASESVRSLYADTPPLGVMDDAPEAACQLIKCEPGDILALITDGFFEWPNNEREQYGIERLEAALKRNRSLSPDEMISAIYEEVRSFAGDEAPDDDLTAVIIKCI